MFEVCYVKNQHQGHKFFSIKIKLLSNTKPSDNTKTIFIYIQFAFLEHTQSTHFEKPQQQLLLTNIRSVERVRACARVCVCVCVCVTRYTNVSVSKLSLITDALFQAGPPIFPLHQIRSGSTAH
jgi:hypothetical protein